MQYTIELNNHSEIFDVDKVAKQAAGAVLLRQGKSVVLATVAHEDKPVEEDFLPLTVQYIEKAYAAGRIPGGYIKRETKPSDSETLTARIIDRSLRPLFPKGYAYPTQIVVLVLSCDSEVDLQVMSLNAASVALYLSDIPMKAPVCGVRIARINDEFKLNPTNTELKKSTLDLFVSGVKDELLMIEMRALPSEGEFIPVVAPFAGIDGQSIQNMNELSEDEIVNALNLAQKGIENGSNAYEEAFSKHRKNGEFELKEENENEQIIKFIEQNYLAKVREAITQMAKSERASELNKIAKEIVNLELAEQNEWDEEAVSKALNKVKRTIVRSLIINEGIRADGRALNEVRPISIETNILPNAHGSCLFTRGQTQALVVATLGSENDAQMSDLLTETGAHAERFMVNYNFPGFSVGEASPIKAPGRRELGHGNLAKRALYPSVDETYPYVIRLVSEILESNGSSSMATVCGGALALRAAGVPSIKLVAGVAMGLVFEEGKSAVLTDIMGLEDHDGDMDFKVAGTRDGVTALQMDIKTDGITREIMQNALTDAHAARIHLLNVMQKAIPEPRQTLSPYAPRVVTIKVPANKVKEIIGKGGFNVRSIQADTNSQIDIEDDGTVKISATSQLSAESAIKRINDLLVEVEVGKDYDGKVVRITDFGAFVNILPGRDGLVHISQITEERVENVNDYLRVGDDVRVRVLDIDNTGRIRLSIKAITDEQNKANAAVEAPTEVTEQETVQVEDQVVEQQAEMPNPYENSPREDQQ